MAVSKVKPIKRDTLNINFTKMILNSGATNTNEAIDYLLKRFLTVDIDESKKKKLINFLNENLGTSNLQEAKSYLEDPIKMVVHLIMSQPEYQLG